MRSSRVAALAAVLVAAFSCKTPTPTSALKDDDPQNVPYKHEIQIIGDPLFAASGYEKPAWVKFAIDLAQPDKVWFQNSNLFPFHYDFATKHLPGWQGAGRAAFDAATLKRAGQKVLLGAVVVSGMPKVREYAIQLVGLDPYDAETVARHYATVKAAIKTPSNQVWDDYYIPVYEQTAQAEADAAALLAKGVRVSSMARWIFESQCYANGWAVGRMTFVPADKIDKAYVSGELKPNDILLTDGVPAEVPSVAGIVSLKPATPNSHVALLAESFRIPFVYVGTEVERARVQALVGKEVAYATSRRGPGWCQPSFEDVTGRLWPEVRTVIDQLKAPPAVAVAAMKKTNKYVMEVATVTEKHLVNVGGKASNFSLLLTAVPDASPTEAKAFTFNLWMAFMKQQAPGGGGTLEEVIAQRLAAHTSYPPNFKKVKDDLKEIRKLIREAPMPSNLKAAIKKGVEGFEPKRKVRFRSSTNVEDTANFSGAGLYDSYSGCIADDLDADDVGPSGCDQTESEEKGIFRAVQRVFASFYNDNAFLERLRHKIPESQVGMAILYHYSFPDDDEHANGVITWAQSQGSSASVTIVSQPGATSVTNPDPSSQPEVARGYTSPNFTSVSIAQASALVPLGAWVLGGEERYHDLIKLAGKVAAAFKARYPQRTSFTLDFEYKLVAPDKLTLKQVREVPIEAKPKPVKAHLVGGPSVLCMEMGENSAWSAMGAQRLNSRLELKMRSGSLARAGMSKSLLDEVRLSHVKLDGSIGEVTGEIQGLTSYEFKGTEDGYGDIYTVRDAFSAQIAEAQASTHELAIEVDEQVDARWESPLRFPEDLKVQLRVKYAKPQPVHGWEGWGTTNEDAIDYGKCWPKSSELASPSKRIKRDLTYPSGVKIKTAYWYPPEPRGVNAGYTAPLIAWETTEITGLTTKPIVLKSEFAKAFKPEHHNFTENFVFQPAADPGLDPDARAELAEKKIVYIFASTDGEMLKLITADGQVKDP